MELKTCSICKEAKKRSAFTTNGKYKAKNGLKTKLRSACKMCENKRICIYQKKMRRTSLAYQEKQRLRKRLYSKKMSLTAKISRNLRKRLTDVLKDEGIKRKVSGVRHLGCSVQECKLYLESKFYPNSETGEMMTWENRGAGNGKWQIDHIKEFREFDLTKKREQKKAVHYTNLQPLWFHDHVEKTTKVGRELKING